MIPKFRIWDIMDKQWATDFTLSLDGDLLCDNGTTLFIRDNFILMQWTGLQDHYKQDVYVGDIIQGHPDSEPLIIEWNTNYGGFAGAYIKTNRMPENLYSIDSNWYHIIGNVYQNPDLIADNR